MVRSQSTTGRESTMTAVFVHGVPETTEVWRRLRGHLDRDSVAVPLPGFGTPWPDSFGATKEEYADWLTAWLRDVPGPVDLVGHDWGAFLVYRIATASGIPLRSWTADVMCGLHQEYEWHEVARYWQTPGVGEEVVRQMIADKGATASTLRERGVPEQDVGEMTSHIDELMGRSILGLYRSAVPNLSDWASDVPTAAPGLVLLPENDASDNRAQAGEIAGRVSAEFRVLPGCGHFWMLDDPEGTAKVLTTFWDSVGS
ncbi:Pimeloyl-ACP methyl ester carboxylesterase [Amycolatopsis sacchari]|uniref:Pimeloyl-ACP methyl ester carboxylesterase n=2 Tax=Amycolatopsis sacchari TaxID=115433 RepID=A0A1I4BBJ3_9PSEU|nr:Pimeloyl-ACP methyl ester carboxylesterase [Amycolatopsis sacchari]